MFIFSIFSFIKSFFSRNDTEGKSNQLTFYFISGLVIFIVLLFILNHYRVKQINELTAKAAVQQQVIQNTIAANHDLAINIDRQQQTTEDSVKIVDQQNTFKDTQRRATKNLIEHKVEKIKNIEQNAQQQIEANTTQAQKEEIKKEEQNQISRVQITSIWQAYCSATNQDQCPQASS
jgi:flagellar biosynthesis GTPase FlhF